MARYSYMPTLQFQGKSTVDDCVHRGYGYFIDSDLRTLEFRDQYGERFIFAPVKRIRFIIFATAIIGIFLGHLI